MSYDMAVWEGEPPADDRTARATFDELYDKYVEHEYPTPATSKITEFVAALTDRWPDTGEGLNDEAPWAAAPLISEASGPFIYFAMSYSRAEEAAPFAAEAAARLGLVCFDPQEGALWG